MTDDLAVARQEKSRIDYLDGLRGFGALSVVLYHGAESIRQTSWATTGPLLLLTNGPFYVTVFFVLSGYVLAASVASGKRPLAASVITRYLRLTVPMTAALIFTWLLYDSVQLPPGPLGAPISTIPGAVAAVTTGLWGVYLHGPPPSNVPLWTMQFELFGSLVIYVIYKVSPRWRMTALLVFAGLSLLRMHALGFAVGAMLWEWQRAGRLRPSRWVWLAGAAYVYFCCNGTFGIAFDPDTIKRQHGSWVALLQAIGAAGLIYLLIVVPFWQNLLRTRPCQFLAHISFALYLVHVRYSAKGCGFIPCCPGRPRCD